MRTEQLMHLANGNLASSTEVIRIATSIMNATDSAYASSRRLIKGLRPENLDVLGLVAALCELVRSYNDLVHKCAFEFSSESDLPEIRDAVAITAYRLVQECLANAVKHSEATLVSTSLDMSSDKTCILLVVADDGVGLPTSLNRDRGSGLGLSAMKERAEEIGGTMTLTSNPKKGTVVSFSLPLN